jgi:hypothetical protein
MCRIPSIVLPSAPQKTVAATFESVAAAELEGVAPRGQVKLPLIRSKSPGSLDLSDYNFDDLLA